MEIFLFVLQSLLLGVGLAMDAFSVSLANGLSEPSMRVSKMAGIAGLFAFFQALMPMIGWVLVHTTLQYFGSLSRFIPWIAFILLCFIGGKMLIDSVKNREEEDVIRKAGLVLLLVQGLATSIDALSVGFTIADYGFLKALWAVLLIAAVTFIFCFIGVFLGKKCGTRMAGKAGILGGTILIVIGVEILVSHLLGG